MSLWALATKPQRSTMLAEPLGCSRIDAFRQVELLLRLLGAQGCQHPLWGEGTLAKDMKAMGVGMVSLANNHATDWGPEGLLESARLLDQGAVKTADFVTATRPLDQVAEAFELASSGHHVKVLVTVSEW